jgi:hypothetical protein
VTSAGKLYEVENGACPCSDFTHRHVICQHALAVRIDRQVQTCLAPEPEPKPDDSDDGLHTTFVQKLSLTYYTHNPLLARAF